MLIASDLSGFRETVQCEPPVNRLEAVRQQWESTLVLEWCIQLSVNGVLLVTDAKTNICDRWHVQLEHQWTQNWSSRNTELTVRSALLTVTNKNKLSFVIHVRAKTLQCISGDSNINFQFRCERFLSIVSNAADRLSCYWSVLDFWSALI